MRSKYGSPSACTILDIPDEILIKIILYLNARERLPLAISHSRFHNLVFEDEELSRDLDFSDEGRLTTAENVQQYFSNIETCKLVRKVNIQNVICMEPGKMLNNSIGKAINLVDLNVHGTEFKVIKQLASFLEPLIHVKRLSVDWPKSKDDDVEICSPSLEISLRRLRYFSVKVYVSSVEFLPNLKLCQELEELRMVMKVFRWHVGDMSRNLKPNKLRNLKIVQVRGWEAMEIKNHLVDMLPDLEEWTDFQLIDFSREPSFYFEKNIDLCEELRETILMKDIPYHQENPAYDMGWFLISEYLLREVIRITHEDVPKTFCCLTPVLNPLEEVEERCLLKIAEAKQLLKDPEYQISFLYFKHSIDSDCDAHLVASAFPNLTELVLCHIIKNNDKVSTSRWKKHFRRCLRRKGSSGPQEEDDPTNLDSSFKMLVENTPYLRDLTIYAHKLRVKSEWWDLDALYLIPQWTNLTTLRLAFIPITDGKFLIDIGKQCANLEKLVLYYLQDNSDSCSYIIDLTQMLSYCKNLRELSVEEFCIDKMSEILNSLSNNLNLRRLSLISTVNMYKYYKLEELIPSIEELLRRCSKLTTLVFINRALYQEDSEKLATALQRIRVDLNRPSFQFQTTPSHYVRNGSTPSISETVYKDASSSFFPFVFHRLD